MAGTSCELERNGILPQGSGWEGDPIALPGDV